MWLLIDEVGHKKQGANSGSQKSFSWRPCFQHPQINRLAEKDVLSTRDLCPTLEPPRHSQQGVSHRLFSYNGRAYSGFQWIIINIWLESDYRAVEMYFLIDDIERAEETVIYNFNRTRIRRYIRQIQDGLQEHILLVDWNVTITEVDAYENGISSVFRSAIKNNMPTQKVGFVFLEISRSTSTNSSLGSVIDARGCALHTFLNSCPNVDLCPTLEPTSPH